LLLSYIAVVNFYYVDVRWESLVTQVSVPAFLLWSLTLSAYCAHSLGRIAQEEREISLESIFHLMRAAEYNDETTAEHLRHTSSYSAAVGRKLGLDDETVQALTYAAPMHDIGKIGIPTQILKKPGKLSPKEWEIMKQHPTIGARILSGSEIGFIQLAEIIALNHHEKWDGSGYPRGLSGEQIPVAARIMAIVDVFDALTSKRAYRDALPAEEAFRIIDKERGKYFDSRVVDAFFAAKDEILSLQSENVSEGESSLGQVTG
ncbi:MAG: HD domain-containing protein, partial [Planctomycetes bacterium]|nr:HD domain-containing protein [Planctomycetota bacterium]